MQNQKNAEPFPYLGIDDYFEFPNPEDADGGVVCAGGNLSPGMLRSAYLQGIFPWFNEDDPLLWWSPDPRFVLFPDEFHVPKSLRRTLNRGTYRITFDAAFERVIRSCAQARRDGPGTWITADMIRAYRDFHAAGFAHSVEAWCGDELSGGFYGVLIGSVFFGESMFTRQADASKAAFCVFVDAFKKAGGKLIDSQVYTDHIARFGGKNISRSAFLRYESEFLPQALSAQLF